MRRWLIAALACGALSFAAAPAPAQVSVDYTVSGTTGDWLLDFSLTSFFAPEVSQKVYFFGVALDGGAVVGSPTAWSLWNGGASWTNAAGTYNTNWITDPHSPSEVGSGTARTGFTARVGTLDAPTTVSWFAYSYGTTPYSAAPGEVPTLNPGFTGTATAVGATVAPEPVSMALLGTGLAGVGALRRRRRRREAAA